MELHLKRMLAMLIAHKEALRVATLTSNACLDQNTAALQAWKELDAKHDGPVPADEWMAAKARFERTLDQVDVAQETVDTLLKEGDRLIVRAAELRSHS
jgi:hypothetical protein|tara:strand:- start:377 stop:673 length:297 start_codon:yes stop_codon:yes gene_type:complete